MLFFLKVMGGLRIKVGTLQGISGYLLNRKIQNNVKIYKFRRRRACKGYIVKTKQEMI